MMVEETKREDPGGAFVISGKYTCSLDWLPSSIRITGTVLRHPLLLLMTFHERSESAILAAG